MEHTFVLIMAGLTSIGTYLLGAKWLRLPSSALWTGLGKTCEVVGSALIFFALNLIVGAMVVSAARWLMGRFVSLYNISDTTLLVLSLLQALTFQAWRAGSPCRGGAEGRHGERLGQDH
jgi:hypothetical protein